MVLFFKLLFANQRNPLNKKNKKKKEINFNEIVNKILI